MSRNICAQNEKDCRNAIEKVFKIMQNSEALLESGFFIDFKSKVCLGEENNNICGEDSAQLIMKGSKSFFLSGPRKIYRDDSTQVVILEDRKLIVINNISPKDKGFTHLDFSQIQDSVLNTSQFNNCKFEIVGTDSCYSTTLMLSELVQKQTGVKDIHYEVNKTLGILKRVEINYLEGKKFKTAIYIINKVNYQYGQEPFAGKAIQYVLNEKGEIRDAYKNFGITDLRQRAVQKK
jgi:hypothetical protein